MKKIISIILTIIIASLALTSCADNAVTTTAETTGTTGQQTPIKKDYAALIYGFSDGVPSAKKDIDLSGQTTTKNPKPNATVRVNGKTYSAEYQGSDTGIWYSGGSDSYTSNDNVTYISYRINTKTQKPEFFLATKFNDKASNYEGRKVYTEEECLALAKEFMKEYVPNIYNYTVVSSESRENKACGIIYNYKFKEYIGDLPIGNTAAVHINRYGDIISFTNNTDIEDVEAFKESGYIETIDWEAIDEAIGEKALEAYTARTNGQTQYTNYRVYSSDKSKNIKTLVRMADGRYALNINAYVLVSTDEYPDRYESFEALMLIYLD